MANGIDRADYRAVFSTFSAFGFGVGALAAPNISGISYISFVGAGVLVFTVLMRTIFEMTSLIDLIRACLNGKFSSIHIFELIYLIIIGFILIEWASLSIRKRIVV